MPDKKNDKSMSERYRKYYCFVFIDFEFMEQGYNFNVASQYLF